MAVGTFTVAGQRVRTSSTRRFVCWTTQRDMDTDAVTVRGIFARSDSVATIRTRISRKGWSRGQGYVIIDTSTGEEV